MITQAPLMQRLRAITAPSTRRVAVSLLSLLALPFFIPLLPIILWLSIVSYTLLLFASWLLSYFLPPKAREAHPRVWDIRNRVRADLCALRWLAQTVSFAPVVIKAWFLTFQYHVPGFPSSCLIKRNIRYAPGRSGMLDVYPPSASLLKTVHHNQSGLSPVIVLLPDHNYGLLKCQKWMLAPLAHKLRTLGYCVVVPQLDSSKGGVESMMRELRMVLNWVARKAATYSGDVSHIYIMGHGFGAHLPLLLTIQAAVVHSRDEFKSQFPEAILSNGVRETKIYGEDIDIPPIEGLILLSPICDTQKHVEYESHVGLTNLSPMRSILGPSLKTCLFHSPAHLLFAARMVMNTEHLPTKFLFVHGGQDEVVEPCQTDIMHELLVGAGVEHVQKSLYRRMGHSEVIKSMYIEERPYSKILLQDVTSMMPLTDS